jgi:plasmid stability protein
MRTRNDSRLTIRLADPLRRDLEARAAREGEYVTEMVREMLIKQLLKERAAEANAT